MAATMPKVQAVGTPAASNTTTIAPAWPAHRAGDIGWLFVVNPNNAITLDTANGFALVTGSVAGTGVAGTGTSVGHAVYWCRATSSSQAAPVVTFPGGFHEAFIITTRYCVATGNPYDTVAADVDTGTNQAFTIPTITTGQDKELVLLGIASATDIATEEASGWTNANLTNLAEKADFWSAAGNGGGMAVASGERASAGAIGTTTGTLVTASKQSRVAIAVKPALHPVHIGSGPKADWSNLHLEDDQTPDSPAGTLTGDIEVLVVESEHTRTIVLTTPNGFAEVTGSPVSIGTDINKSEKLTVFWRRLTSDTMASPVIDLTDNPAFPNQEHFCAQIHAFRGGLQSGYPFDVFSTGTQDIDNDTSITIPGATTTLDNELVIAISTNSDDLAANATSGWTNADLAFIFECGNVASSFGKGGAVATACGPKVTAGAYGNTTASWAAASPANGQAQANMTLTLKPATSSIAGDIQAELNRIDNLVYATKQASQLVSTLAKRLVDEGVCGQHVTDKSKALTQAEADAALDACNAINAVFH